MKVTDVRVEAYRWARNKPIRNGLHTYTQYDLNVVKIETDEGVTGIGIGRDIREAPNVGIAMVEFFKQFVIGEDPFDTEKIWE